MFLKWCVNQGTCTKSIQTHTVECMQTQLREAFGANGI